MNDCSEAQVLSIANLISEIESGRETEKIFVNKAQDKEKQRYAEMENMFRERSDAAPEQLVTIQEKTRVRTHLVDQFCIFLMSAVFILDCAKDELRVFEQVRNRHRVFHNDNVEMERGI